MKANIRARGQPTPYLVSFRFFTSIFYSVWTRSQCHRAEVRLLLRDLGNKGRNGKASRGLVFTVPGATAIGTGTRVAATSIVLSIYIRALGSSARSLWPDSRSNTRSFSGIEYDRRARIMSAPRPCRSSRNDVEYIHACIHRSCLAYVCLKFDSITVSSRRLSFYPLIGRQQQYRCFLSHAVLSAVRR